MPSAPAHYPARAPIDSYGNGGFRFAGMSHRGSILIVPSGIYAWDVVSMDDVNADCFAPLFRELKPPAFVLLGTGAKQVMPAAALRQAFADCGLELEPMSTGAACRTYNVLLAEGRDLGAALIAVD